MILEFENTISIARPPDEVFAYMTTPSNWPHYAPGMVAATQLDDGPMQAGTQMLIKIGTLGTLVEIKVQFDEFEPSRFFASRNIDDPKVFTLNRTTLTPEGDGTRVHRWASIEPRSFFVHLSAPLIRAAVSRNNRREFQNLKTILEGGPDALGPRRDPLAVAPG